ncbi:MAG: hypothetical protein WCT24_03965 [Patescibacteria group bacterium]
MSTCLTIINKKIGYLLPIARGKANEWFSDDRTLTQITAERYLLDYLRSKNPSLLENFKGGGVDAFLPFNTGKVGVEVTTINKSIDEWVFHERLLMYLDSNNFDKPISVEVRYKLSDLFLMSQIKEFSLIEKVGNMIINESYGEINGINITKINDVGSYISWCSEQEDYNFFSTIETKLNEIFIQKATQLKNNDANLLFVGTNQLPTNEFYPEIIRELKNPDRFIKEIEALERMIQSTLPKYVLGLCFFEYSLDKEYPFYPLKIIWKDFSNTIPISI